MVKWREEKGRIHVYEMGSKEDSQDIVKLGQMSLGKTLAQNGMRLRNCLGKNKNQEWWV